MKVKVTAKDIKQGVRSEICKCPIALAMARATHRQELAVYINSVYDWKAAEEVCNLPPEATHFIVEFDAGRPVKPFTFETI